MFSRSETGDLNLLFLFWSRDRGCFPIRDRGCFRIRSCQHCCTYDCGIAAWLAARTGRARTLRSCQTLPLFNAFVFYFRPLSCCLLVLFWNMLDTLYIFDHFCNILIELCTGVLFALTLRFVSALVLLCFGAVVLLGGTPATVRGPSGFHVFSNRCCFFILSDSIRFCSCAFLLSLYFFPACLSSSSAFLFSVSFFAYSFFVSASFFFLLLFPACLFSFCYVFCSYCSSSSLWFSFFLSCLFLLFVLLSALIFFLSCLLVFVGHMTPKVMGAIKAHEGSELGELEQYGKRLKNESEYGKQSMHFVQ